MHELTPDDVVMWELGQVPLHVSWQKMLLKFVGQLVDLLGDRLVKKLLHKFNSDAPLGINECPLVV